MNVYQENISQSLVRARRDLCDSQESYYRDLGWRATGSLLTFKKTILENGLKFGGRRMNSGLTVGC